MPLINTSQEEFTDRFRRFYENCPSDLEKSSIPFERTDKAITASTFPQLLPDPKSALNNHFRGPSQQALVLAMVQAQAQREAQAQALAQTPSSNGGSCLLLNLDPNVEEDLCRTIAGDFYSHARERQDFKIQSVHLLRNPVLWRRYQAEKQLRRQLAEQERSMRQQARARSQPLVSPAISVSQANLALEEEDPKLLFRDEIMYHGTLQQRIPSILLNGLDPRMTVRANYGKGVYFSDSIEKCMQYVDKQTKMEQEYSVVLCCVLLGRVLVEPFEKGKRKLGNHTMFLPEGYDSAVMHDVFKEWVIYEKSQILPLCVINFKASNKPDCFFRLCTHTVLFRDTGFYHTSISEIQRTCTVPTPTDYNQHPDREAMLKSQIWKDVEEDTGNMLLTVFKIPLKTAQVCYIKFENHMDWAFKVHTTGGDQFFYMNDSQMIVLLRTSKNIELLQARNVNEKQLTYMNRIAQRATIGVELSKIPDGVKLLEILTELEPDLQQIQEQGRVANAAIEQCKNELVQAGKAHVIGTHDYQLHIHPLQERLTELRKLYEVKFVPLSSWPREHIDLAEKILRMQRTLQNDIREDQEKDTRQQAAIEAEMERSNKYGLTLIKVVLREELDRRFGQAKDEREAIEQLKGYREDFRMKDVELSMMTVTIWPLVVAELLMPTLMIKTLHSVQSTYLNDHSPTNRIGALRLDGNPHKGIKDVSEWWHVASEILFGAPAATSAFWPIDPRRRLPNRRLFKFKDYIEWVFLEKEHRLRKRDWRTNQGPGSLPPENFMMGVDVQKLLQDQWDRLDPSIALSIEGLSSRFGTVVFNREERQKELDQMGTDLLGELFVEAEAHMLMRNESPSTKATVITTAAATGASSSALPPAECPICQENLEIPDPKAKTTSIASIGATSTSTPAATSAGATALAPEKVVKLKSCRHCFHEDCIKEWFRSKDAQLKCPMCNTMCTTEGKAGATKNAIGGGRPQKLGPMPDGMMGYSFDVRLACYFIYIIIPSHTIPNPHPSSSGNGSQETITVPNDIRYAIMPFSARLGPLLMIRLISLFYYGHLFRVGQSLTRGLNNVVVWNGVHLRTAMSGNFGFPAPNFESNCWQEINQKGVAMGLEELALNMPMPDGSAHLALTSEDQQIGGIQMPREMVEEMAAEARAKRLFHRDQPWLFGQSD